MWWVWRPWWWDWGVGLGWARIWLHPRMAMKRGETRPDKLPRTGTAPDGYILVTFFAGPRS